MAEFHQEYRGEELGENQRRGLPASDPAHPKDHQRQPVLSKYYMLHAIVGEFSDFLLTFRVNFAQHHILLINVHFNSSLQWQSSVTFN